MHSRPVTPLLAVDILIELADRPDRPIVLIERRNEPFGWAVPGGFVDVGERVEDAAVREAREETSLDVTLTALLGIYSDPCRDARGHTVTAAYAATATGQPIARDDANAIRVCLPENPPTPLVFDHTQMLDDFCEFRRSGRRTPLRMRSLEY